MKFVCLGFIDESKFAQLPEAEAIKMMEECLTYDDQLRRDGHFLGGEALEPASRAVTLRPAGGNIEVTDGPFAETKEVLGGILLLEARDMQHAVELISKHPGAQMGPWEIRASDEAFHHMVAERIAKLAKPT